MIKLYSRSVRLRLIQVFSVLLMFDIEVVTNSGGILANKIGFRMVLILLVFSYLLIYCRLSNALVNLCVIGSC